MSLKQVKMRLSSVCGLHVPAWPPYNAWACSWWGGGWPPEGSPPRPGRKHPPTFGQSVVQRGVGGCFSPGLGGDPSGDHPSPHQEHAQALWGGTTGTCRPHTLLRPILTCFKDITSKLDQPVVWFSTLILTPNPDLHGLINLISVDHFCVILLSAPSTM